MRRPWSWLSAVVAGFLIGPAPIAAEPDDDEPIGSEDVARRKMIGHAVQGIDFYVWDEDSTEAAAWALALAQSPGERTRTIRWRAIAARTAALPSVSVSEQELAFAARADEHEGSSLTALGLVLCLLPSLDRTYVISSWATSPDEHVRRTLARALAAPFEALGVDCAIGHLQEDPNAEVARLARSAAAARAASLA